MAEVIWSPEAAEGLENIIIYRIGSDAIEVVMVRHGARIIRPDEVDSPRDV